jgi:hypothetical protein
MKKPLRETLIRIGGRHLLNENNIIKINKFYKNDPKSNDMKKENVKLIKLLNNEVKKVATVFNDKFSNKPNMGSDEPFNGAIGKVDGATVAVDFAGDGGPYSGPSITSSPLDINYRLKGNESIKDIAKLIVKLIKDKKKK